jgi:hypothetical protein
MTVYWTDSDEERQQDQDHAAGNGRCPCEICQSRWVGADMDPDADPDGDQDPQE